MTSRIQEFVQERYSSIQRCLEAYAAFIPAGADLAAYAQYDVEERKEVPEKIIGAYDIAVGSMKDALAKARPALDTLKPYLDALGGAPMYFAGEYAPSLAEALVLAVEGTVETAETAETVLEQGKELAFWLFQRRQVRLPTPDHPEQMLFDPNREQAELVGEAGRLVSHMEQRNVDPSGDRPGLWRIRDDEVEFEGGLRDLQGLGSDFLRQLILAKGGTVTYSELEDKVWFKETDQTTIRQAKHQLTKDLAKLGVSKVADAIKAVQRGYRLSFPE